MRTIGAQSATWIAIGTPHAEETIPSPSAPWESPEFLILMISPPCTCLRYDQGASISFRCVKCSWSAGCDIDKFPSWESVDKTLAVNPHLSLLDQLCFDFIVQEGVISPAESQGHLGHRALLLVEFLLHRRRSGYRFPMLTSAAVKRCPNDQNLLR